MEEVDTEIENLEEIIPIYEDTSLTPFTFQQCIVESCTLLENLLEDGAIDGYVLIECKERRNSEFSDSPVDSPVSYPLRFLNRVSIGRSSTGARSVLKCDFRVLELENRDDPDLQELELANQIARLKRRLNYSDLVTTPERIHLLKSTVIKSMRVTVISGSYPDSWRIQRTKELLSQFVGRILKGYDLRVRSRSLVDLRECSLSKSYASLGQEYISPEFIYVEECKMKNSSDDSLLIGRIGPKTQIIVKKIHQVNYYSRLVEYSKISNYGEFLGVEQVYETLSTHDFLQRLNREDPNEQHPLSHNLLLAGPSGCGKTWSICESAKILRANLIVFKIGRTSSSNSSRFSSYRGLNDVFAKAIKSGGMYPTILVIEGLELLHSGSSQGDQERKSQKYKAWLQKERIVNQLCDLMAAVPPSCSLTIVATTSKPHLIPKKLRIFPRFQQEITINVPSESVRLKILQSFTKNIPAVFTPEDLESLARRTPGYVGADLMKVVQWISHKLREDGGNVLSESHVKYALAHVFPSALQGSSLGWVDIQRLTSLDHIAGLHPVKLDLIKAIVWPLNFPQAFLRMGIQPFKGILLYGPPGCGKTTLVRALAASHQTNFLSVSAAALFSSGVGDSEKIVAHLFHRARMASPCILFIDELDSIVGSREVDSGKAKVNETILTMLLTEMDGIGIRVQTTTTTGAGTDEGQEFLTPRVVVVGATNRPDLIDSALLRPGRFDRLIPVPPPDEAGRLDLLRKTTLKTPHTPDVDLGKLAKETEGYSGSDVVKLVREAALFALAEDINRCSVSMEHYIKAKSELAPSLLQQDGGKYLNFFYEYASRVDKSEYEDEDGSEVVDTVDPMTIEHLTREMSVFALGEKKEEEEAT